MVNRCSLVCFWHNKNFFFSDDPKNIIRYLSLFFLLGNECICSSKSMLMFGYVRYTDNKLAFYIDWWFQKFCIKCTMLSYSQLKFGIWCLVIYKHTKFLCVCIHLSKCMCFLYLYFYIIISNFFLVLIVLSCHEIIQLK